MSFYTTRATLTRTGPLTSRCTIPYAPLERVDWIPGQPHVGVYQPGSVRRGSRSMGIDGVQFELRGQSGSGTQTPEGDIFKAAGFVRSGTTGFTFTLGDPHVDSETPDGDTVRIASIKVAWETQQFEMANAIADVSFLFRAGEIPIVTANFMGIVPTGTGLAASTRSTVAVPSVTVGPLPAEWVNSTVAMNSVALLADAMPLLEIETGTRNRMTAKRAAQGEHGYANPEITGRNPGGRMLFETPPESTIAWDDLVLTNAAIPLSWTYVAGGSTFRTYTFTQTVILTDIPRPVELDGGRLGYEIPFEQDPTTGALAFTVT